MGREAHPRRFRSEASAQTGEKDPSLETLFQVLVESVEVSALGWGCERWSPWARPLAGERMLFVTCTYN